MAYYILFSANNRIYKQNTHVHTQGRAENSLFQFCLTITKPFSPFFLEEMKKKQKKLNYIIDPTSRTWSFVCLGRFARRTKKEEKLPVV